MWVSCSNFRELELARVSGRLFGRIGDFSRLADELAWGMPAGLVIVSLCGSRISIYKRAGGWGAVRAVRAPATGRGGANAI